jgi:hypothetical protein
VLWKERGRNGRATAFQADDEGSIPFTRSNIFKSLRQLTDFIPTSQSDKAAAFVRRLFARRHKVRWPP